MRIPPGHPDYSRWIVNSGDPKEQRSIVPMPALADVALYDGSRARVEVDVVATAPGLVCVRQDLGDRHWFAWVAAQAVQRQ